MPRVGSRFSAEEVKGAINAKAPAVVRGLH